MALRFHLTLSCQDSFYYLHISGTATEIARNGRPDLPLRWVGVSPEQGGGAHNHPRSTETTLDGPLADECLLQGIERTSPVQSLDRSHVSSLCLRTEDEARVHCAAVEQDRAGPAVSTTTAFFGPGQPEVFAEDSEQGSSGRDSKSDRVPIHSELQGDSSHGFVPIAGVDRSIAHTTIGLPARPSSNRS